METNPKFYAIVAALVLAQDCNAGDFYENPHDVMIETIRNGQASGVMSGIIARKFEKQFSSNGVLLFEARKLFSYKQEGCARIEIDYTKKDVLTANGITEVNLKTQINYCLDGRPPTNLEPAQ